MWFKGPSLLTSEIEWPVWTLKSGVAIIALSHVSAEDPLQRDWKHFTTYPVNLDLSFQGYRSTSRQHLSKGQIASPVETWISYGHWDKSSRSTVEAVYPIETLPYRAWVSGNWERKTSSLSISALLILVRGRPCLMLRSPPTRKHHS